MFVKLLCLFEVMCVSLCVFFFFKQKTAYEMRISDWSSDVCSSDLGFLLTVGVDLKGKGLAMLEDGSAVEPDARYAEHGELDRQHRAFLAARIVEQQGRRGDRKSTRLNSSH